MVQPAKLKTSVGAGVPIGVHTFNLLHLKSIVGERLIRISTAIVSSSTIGGSRRRCAGSMIRLA